MHGWGAKFFLDNAMEDEDKAIDVEKKLAAGANSAKPKKISMKKLKGKKLAAKKNSMKKLKRKQVEEEEVEVEQPESDASFGTDGKL